MLVLDFALFLDKRMASTHEHTIGIVNAQSQTPENSKFFTHVSRSFAFWILPLTLNKGQYLLLPDTARTLMSFAQSRKSTERSVALNRLHNTTRR